MKNVKMLAILNAVSFLLHLVLAQLTQLRLLSDFTIGDVSDKYPTLFTPAGITFSIWGLIYILLIIFCIYHLVKAFKAEADHEANLDLQKIGYLFIVNSLATGAWTIAWVYEELVISVLLMLVQLVTLIAIHIRLSIYDSSRSSASRWFTQVPLSIYFGWIIIATVANISATLVGNNWTGFNLTPEFWTILMMLIAALITIYIVIFRRNVFVGLVTMWAFYGINLKHQGDYNISSPAIILTAWVGLVIVGLVVLFTIYRNTTTPPASTTNIFT
jgi:hypothetical protein